MGFVFAAAVLWDFSSLIKKEQWKEICLGHFYTIKTPLCIFVCFSFFGIVSLIVSGDQKNPFCECFHVLFYEYLGNLL